MIKYKDNYEVSFCETEDFLEEVADHEENITRTTVKVSDLHVYEGKLNPENSILTLSRIVHGIDDTVFITEEYVTVDEDDVPAIMDTIENGTGLFIKDDNGSVWPLSDNAKTSLGNRTNLSFRGEISELPTSRIALADMYEKLIHANAKRSLQVISIYGKAQSIVSSKYVPSNQIHLFKKIGELLSEKYSDTEILTGYVSHTATSCLWELGSAKENKNVKILLRVADSSTGDNSISFSPAVRVGRRKAISFDSAFNARHYKITDNEIEEGLAATLLKAQDNSAELVNTMNIQLKYPDKYIRNAIKSLNKLAKRMGSAAINKRLTASVLEMFESVSMAKTDFTVWDITELLWELPTQCKSDAVGISLEKTVSRILTLKHDKLDVEEIDD